MLLYRSDPLWGGRGTRRSDRLSQAPATPEGNSGSCDAGSGDPRLSSGRSTQAPATPDQDTQAPATPDQEILDCLEGGRSTQAPATPDQEILDCLEGEDRNTGLTERCKSFRTFQTTKLENDGLGSGENDDSCDLRTTHDEHREIATTWKTTKYQ